MKLSRLVLARVAIARAVALRLLRSPALRDKLARSRTRPIDGNVVDPHIAAMLAVGDLIGATELMGKTPGISRAQMAESSKMVEEEPCDGMFIEDLTLSYGGQKLSARRYVPAGLSAGSPGVVYYHGGGFVLGDLDSHDRHCQTLARDADARVFAIDYRLAPEHPFPAAVDDGVSAFRCIAERAREFDVDPDRLAVMGDSAGGNLAAVVSRKTRKDAVRPALQVLVYPAVDATCASRSHEVFADGWILTTKTMQWFYECYLGTDPAARRDIDASPLLADDLAGLPPALVYTAGFDPLRDEGIAYAERLEKAGIAVRQVCFGSMIHGFAGMGAVSPGARGASMRMSRDVGAALREGLSKTAVVRE